MFVPLKNILYGYQRRLPIQHMANKTIFDISTEKRINQFQVDFISNYGHKNHNTLQ